MERASAYACPHAVRRSHTTSCRPRTRRQQQPSDVDSSSTGTYCCSRRRRPAGGTMTMAMTLIVASLITPGARAFRGARSQATLATAMGEAGNYAGGAAQEAASNLTSDGRYEALGPVADGSFREKKQGGGLMGRVGSKMRSMAGNLTSIASTSRAWGAMPDDVWAAASVTNGSSLITARGVKSPNKAIERIKSVLGNNTLPLPVGPLDFSIPIPKPDPLTLVALSIAGVTMIGSFLSALVGFAFALTTTSLLSNLIGSKTAQPLVAILFFVNQCILLHKKGLGDWRETAVLIAASFVTVPMGIFLLLWVDAAVGESVLGLLIVCYVLYSIADMKLPELNSRWHTIGTGLFAGLTVGAFNIGGPWIAMYGQCRRWRADKFASNLITYQAPTCVFALAVHIFRGSFLSKELWYYAACAIPGMFIGSQIGEMVSKRINESTFKTLTMLLIAVMGSRLLLNGLPPRHVGTVVCLIGTAAGALLYQKRQRPRDKNLVLPVGTGITNEQESEGAGHHDMTVMKGTPSVEDETYLGGDAEYGETGEAEGGGMHHRGTQHQ